MEQLISTIITDIRWILGFLISFIAKLRNWYNQNIIMLDKVFMDWKYLYFCSPLLERWQSGRMHWSWKPAYREVPGVRIPLSPLKSTENQRFTLVFFMPITEISSLNWGFRHKKHRTPKADWFSVVFGTVPPSGIFWAKRKKSQPPWRLGPDLFLATLFQTRGFIATRTILTTWIAV